MKNTFLKMYFHSETDSGAASDFQKGQYSQCSGFSNEPRSWWCYSSPVHSHLSQTPLCHRTVPCSTQHQAGWATLAACVWRASFVVLPSLLGRSRGQGPGWLCAHATPCTLPVRSSSFCTQGRREDGDGPVEKAAFCCWDVWFWGSGV